MSSLRKGLFLLVMLVGSVVATKGQNVALKTNLLWDAACTANLGVEFGLAPKWTMDISANYNGWMVNERQWKHWLIQPEARYWFCDRFAGHFLGVHALGGEYNVGNLGKLPNFIFTNFGILEKHRIDGWAVGAGIAYGYAFTLGKHWNLELEIGWGYVYTRYDMFECDACGRKVLDDVPHHYTGPTKAAANLVYVF